jgi:hypothetical protein
MAVDAPAIAPPTQVASLQMQEQTDRPATVEVRALLDALDASLNGVAHSPRNLRPRVDAAPTAREALDQLAAVFKGCAERLRAQRDADGNRVSALRTTRLAWVWHVTGLRLRDVGPRRARTAVLRQLRSRAVEDSVIAPACTRAVELIGVVLAALDREAARNACRSRTPNATADQAPARQRARQRGA